MSSDGARARAWQGGFCAGADARVSRADEGDAPGDEHHKAKHFKDCPITFSSSAARRRMPLALLELSGQRDKRWQQAVTRKFGADAAKLPGAPGDSYRSGSYASHSAAGGSYAGSYADLAALDRREPAGPIPEAQPLVVTTSDAYISKFALMSSDLAAQERNGDTGEPAPPRDNLFDDSDDSDAPPPGDRVQRRDSLFDDTDESVAAPEPEPEEPPRHAEPISVELAERIWATVLSLAVMEAMDVCWLVDDEAEPERTVVDAAREWLEARAEEDERIKELLESGELQKDAKRAIRDWKRIMEASVSQLRKNDVLNRFTALTHLQRASGRVIKSLMTDHGCVQQRAAFSSSAGAHVSPRSTFATFLDADGYIMRWQRWMILVTIVMSTLLVSIWFYSSRGTQCCQEVRALLDAGAGKVCGATPPPAPPMSPFMPPLPPAPFTPPGVDVVTSDATISPSGCPPVGPCLGFTGGCNDIPEQFIDLAGCYVYGDPGAEEEHEFLDEYVCHAFPDDAYVTDQFFVALIGVAVALPVDMFLQHAFEVANEVDGAPESWLIWRGLWKMLLGKKAHAEWHFTDESRKHPSELAMFIIREDDPAWPDVVVFIVTWVPGRIVAMFKHLLGIKDAEEKEEEEEEESSEGSVGAEARRDRLMKRLYASAGLIGIYVTWAIFSWFIFVRARAKRVVRCCSDLTQSGWRRAGVRHDHMCVRLPLLIRLCRRAHLLLYADKNLGPEAQDSFSQTWGVSYALDNCTEWQDVRARPARKRLREPRPLSRGCLAGCDRGE